ncbi:4-hydroxy-tetrahydrodipicolinate reductase [Rhodanobacter sp. DHG33]|uniref:4-hydroxy-tetrahydrodipicolinate reductase n=1 Tax=Rhodanobacter sp. DHG33 TaxID=2775921 RepID=UPI00177D0FE0|nr:4-hydroxy-tetrahydrodipicolinate reductase [Rhodanobacter sp. DHG33]MBD8900414.1 4-hydroxy-tetrahydrodipicolinate reductase [Rhodanobacter sp. DHG33]
MTSSPLRLAINGASGRMGQALLSLLRVDGRYELAHAVVSPGSVHDGEPVWLGQGLRYAHDWSRAPSLDAVIDFSGPAGLTAALEHCLAHGIPLVTGTTGLDAAQQARLDAAGTRIALLRAANFSLGVALLSRLLREAAAAMPEWDLEIVEAHHGRKQDAPSGTALALGHAAAAARGTTLEASAVYSREGRTGERVPGSIGFAVVRGGDIVGEHQALLIGQGERLELGHRATDRTIFARGALQAARWLVGRAAGHWQLEDVFAPLG